MGSYKVSDNAATTLAASITNNPGITALVLANGANFPVVNHGGSGSDWSYVTLFDSAGNIETVKVTRRDSGSNTLTIVRGTAAGITGVTDASCLAWASGSTGVACRLIAQTVNDLAASAATATAAALDAAASAAIVELSAGTRMPFAQATAPTGWTQDVSDSADNRMLRVVKTAGGGAGGSHSPILNNVVPAHTHTFSTNVVDTNHYHYFDTGVSGGHEHIYNWQNNGNNAYGGPSGNYIGDGKTDRWTTGGGGHSHAGNTMWMSQNNTHSHTGSTDNGSSATNWTPRYVDLIICTKN